MSLPWITLVYPCRNISYSAKYRLHCLLNTKCRGWNQQKFSLDDVHEQTVQRVHQVQELGRFIVSCQCCAAPLRRRGGRLEGGGVCLLCSLPSAAWAGYGCRCGRTSPSSQPSLRLSTGGGGSMLRRNLSARGVATPLAPSPLPPNISL